MDERLSRLEARLDDMIRSLRNLEARVSALEIRIAETGAGAPAPRGETASLPEERRADQPSAVGTFLAQIGRVLVVLAGAFLLRAITNAGYVPLAVGTALGMGYALLWTALADRAARRRSLFTAHALGLAAAAIGFPLLAEATTKTHLLNPAASAAALAGLAGVIMGVAARHRLPGLAWIVVLFALGHALGLAGSARAFVPYAGTVLFLGLLSLGSMYWRRWRLLGWFVTLVLDAFLIFVVALVLFNQGSKAASAVDPGHLVLVLLGLVIVYLGGFGVAAVVAGRDIGVFEVLQTAAVALIGLGGAGLVGRAAGLPSWPLGGVCLVLAAGGYSIAFAFVDRWRRRNFHFFTNVALVLALAAGNFLLSRGARSIAFALLAIPLAWLAGRTSRRTLSVHGALYATMAALVSGLLPLAARAFLRPPPDLQAWTNAPMLLSLGVAGVIVALRGPVKATTWGRLSRLPKLLLLAVLAAALGGILVTVIAVLLGGRAHTDPGLIAAVRTVILALSAVLLALIGRRERTREAGWLVIPVLVVGGLKLLGQDLAVGRPITLVVSLAALGGSLLVAPRLARVPTPE